MKNLELWDKVEKTNPKYTKKANVRGNNITSIAPQFQIKSATEQFGIYGVKWGFKKVEFNYSLQDFGLVVFNAVFYFPKGEFPISNAISLYRDNAKTKIDSDFAKKVETDTLTKALSKLGFNADIFLGKFDDLRYVDDMKKEFDKSELPELRPQDTEDWNKAVKALESYSKEDVIKNIETKWYLSDENKKLL